MGVRRSRRRPRRFAFVSVSIVVSIVVSIALPEIVLPEIVLPEIVHPEIVGNIERFRIDVTADVREQRESPSPDLAREIRQIVAIHCNTVVMIVQYSNARYASPTSTRPWSS